MPTKKRKTAGRGRKKPRNFTSVAKETLIKDFGCDIAEECENRIARNVKRDLLGFADMVGLSPDGWVLLQFTSKINFNSRKYKIRACKNALYVVKYNIARIIVIGFDDTKYCSDYKILEFTLEDFDESIEAIQPA